MSNSLFAEKERPTTVTVLVDRELRARLERAAAANERSLGAAVRHVLRAHLERDDGKEDGDGDPNGVLGYLDEHELATPQRVGILRAHGIPEAPFADFEIHETGAGHFSFIDKATGVEYRRGPDPTLQAPGVSDVVAFTIDAANRLHYLRPRGPKARRSRSSASSWKEAEVNPSVVSIGDDFRQYPRRLWGTRDRLQAAREDRARAALEASKPLPTRFEPLPGPPPPAWASWFTLHAPPSHADRRRLGLPPRPGLDARLAKLGIRPRR